MSKRILVVEDQEDNRQILRDLLTSADFEVIEAVDGDEATRRLKADAALRDIPIIVVTSYALGGDAEKARAAGCDAYISKPYSPRQLLAKVREYLSPRRPLS